MSAYPLESQISLFRWKSIAVYHGGGVLKVGTDAILLGTWIPKVVHHATNIIDAGCGSGILSIMAAAAYPSSNVLAIDSNDQAIALTQLNAMHNQLQDRITCTRGDLLHTDHAQVKVDLVISNPPYYVDQLLPADNTRRSAKHTESEPCQWLHALEARCHANGSIGVIVPFQLVACWIGAANEHELYCQRRMNVYSYRDDVKPKRSMLLLGRVLHQPTVETMVMYEDGRNLTDDYLAWIK